MRVLTGIKPTNILHIGNLFGGLAPAVALQSEHEVFMMVADLHAITVPQEPGELKANIAFAVAAYLAAGIDPKKTVLFQQSQVPAHAELGWLLACQTKMGEAERMTQYKDKARVKGENVSVGLFTYPILMAADILLYGAEAVPVGQDQKQHLEMARDLAERMNKTYREDLFLVPKPLIQTEGAKIMGLDDSSIKMSKSASSPKNYLSLLDDADTLRKKIRSAVSDEAGMQNLRTLYSLCTGTSIQHTQEQFPNSQAKDLKDATADAVIAYLSPIQRRIHELLADKTTLTTILSEGSARANAVANQNIAEIKQTMGFVL